MHWICHYICIPHAGWGAAESRQHLPGPSREAQKRPTVLFKDNHRWWEADLEVKSENQETVIAVEEPIISMANPPPQKKGKKRPLQSEEHVCYDFTELRITNSYHMDKP